MLLPLALVWEDSFLQRPKYNRSWCREWGTMEWSTLNRTFYHSRDHCWKCYENILRARMRGWVTENSIDIKEENLIYELTVVWQHIHLHMFNPDETQMWEKDVGTKSHLSVRNYWQLGLWGTRTINQLSLRVWLLLICHTTSSHIIYLDLMYIKKIKRGGI